MAFPAPPGVCPAVPVSVFTLKVSWEQGPAEKGELCLWAPGSLVWKRGANVSSLSLKCRLAWNRSCQPWSLLEHRVLQSTATSAACLSSSQMVLGIAAARSLSAQWDHGKHLRGLLSRQRSNPRSCEKVSHLLCSLILCPYS